EVYARTEGLPADSVPPAPTAAERQPFDQATLPAGGRRRVLGRRLHPSGREVTVVLMAPLGGGDRGLGVLLSVLTLAVPVVLIVSGGLGYLLARKALAPVKQLHRLTQEITADHLDRRLPVANARDELGRLAQTINAMIGRLERSFAEVRRFTADA